MQQTLSFLCGIDDEGDTLASLTSLAIQTAEVLVGIGNKYGVGVEIECVPQRYVPDVLETGWAPHVVILPICPETTNRFDTVQRAKDTHKGIWTDMVAQSWSFPLRADEVTQRWFDGYVPQLLSGNTEPLERFLYNALLIEKNQ